MHSRDELRSRAPELAPQQRTLSNGATASWPTDPDAGGTWVAVRDDGLYLGLLNLNLRDDELDPRRPTPTISRGSVIPALIESATLDDAVDRLKSMTLRGMNPFRLLIAGPGSDGCPRYTIARFDAMELGFPCPIARLERPVCMASSGLGDELVQCRVPLFGQMVSPHASQADQHRFHRHQWPDRPELSVLMSREDARTSSITTVVVEAGKEPTVFYEPIAVGDPADDPVGAGMLQ